MPILSVGTLSQAVNWRFNTIAAFFLAEEATLTMH